jgi:hypothetical protein
MIEKEELTGKKIIGSFIGEKSVVLNFSDNTKLIVNSSIMPHKVYPRFTDSILDVKLKRS